MSLYYYSPYRQARHMMRRMMENSQPVSVPNVWFPVDVRAEADDYVIAALVPGMQAEDINIQIVGDTITIQGEFNAGRQESEEYLLRERPEGRFNRTITMPITLNASKSEAKLENGVLTLRVPKAEEARPKAVKVIAK